MLDHLLISGDGGPVALQVGDDDSMGLEHDQLRGDLLEELELQRERPALPAYFVSISIRTRSKSAVALCGC